ncbi:MFS transporter [Nocardioides nitrophenolicus]|uniref:MFS transporter n=1 Tax=Nocardioides nitrophenolicus TaxID=60489 RepID=UPI00195B39D6|nr:MFS transporter [Nocardioides nitrophenolicus]MBM7515974.1 DHA2 family multidrug resistance protein-like MFS transporter [Nocardioides nitrophenolicus]
MSALSAPRSAPARDRRRWGGLAVLAASLLVVVMDMTVLNVALPDLTEDLHAGALAQLWIVDVYSLVLAGLLVPVAALADRWGRRRMLLTGFAIFAVASLAALVARSPGDVIAVRALLGVGGAMIMPATLSLIRALFPDARERAFALGLWAATAAVGGAVGPIVGGALLSAFSWHAAFLVNVPLMVAALVAGLLLLPESRSERPGRVDVLGTVLSVGGMVAAVYGVKHLGKGDVDVVTLLVLAAGVAMLALFVLRCLHQDDPMLAVRLFANPVFRSGVVTALVSSTAMMALLFVGSQWLQLVQGWSPLRAGVALLPMALGGLVGPPLAPAVAARFGARNVIVAGLVVLAAGLALLRLLPHPMPYAGVAGALLLVGFGTAALGLASALIMGAAPVHQAGSAAAVEEMSYEVGGVLGIALLGSLAGVVYRHGLPGGAPDAAVESVTGALGTPVEPAALASYTDAFATVGLVGAVITLLVAIVVWRQLPKDVDVSGGH